MKNVKVGMGKSLILVLVGNNCFYGARTFRPLARRALMILRPAEVDMRFRNP